MTKSWKTSVTGIIAVLTSVFGIVEHIINGTPIDYETHLAAFMAGIGLIFAKDSQVTGGTIKQ